MPKAKPSPLNEGLMPVQKGAAMPAPEPGKRREAPPERVSMTFRITTQAYEQLRRAAFEQRISQQALVDMALAQFFGQIGDSGHGRTAARLHATMEG